MEYTETKDVAINVANIELNDPAQVPQEYGYVGA